MKKLITILLAALAAFSARAADDHGHSHGNEFGPNGGRLVALAEGNPLHVEVVLNKEGKFVIGLFDEKTKKPVPVTTQTLVLTHKEKKAKLTPELKDGKWVVAKPEGDDFWLIFQVKPAADAKALVARLHYDAAICGGCNKPEWLCTCDHDHGDEKKEEPKKDEPKKEESKK